MDKKEVAAILEIILDGLTAGESSEKKLEETKKFYTDELNKANREKQFYERVIRFCLLERYTSIKESTLGRYEVDGSKLFSHQYAAHNNLPTSELEFSLDDFRRFVDEYLTAARDDAVIGIKEA